MTPKTAREHADAWLYHRLRSRRVSPLSPARLWHIFWVECHGRLASKKGSASA